MKKLFVFGPVLLMVIGAHSLTVDDYLEQYKSKNDLYKSGFLSVEVSQGKIDSADLDLSPLLNVDYLKNSDESLPSQLSPHRELEQYGVGLAKKFTTGTQLKLEAKTYKFENEKAVFPGYDQYSTGVLGLSFKQSLWKDFFGKATRAKLDRIKKAGQLEKTAAELQLKGQLLEAEILFWDYAYVQEDLKLKTENLKRAQKLLSWTNKRLSNGISEKADMLNAQSLVAVRELQVITSENDLKSAEIKLKQALNLAETESLPKLSLNLSQERHFIQDLSKKSNVIKIENYLSLLESQVRTLAAEETDDSLKPELNLFGSYNYTSYNREYQKTLSEITDSKYPQSTIGLNLTWLLGGASKASVVDSMMKEMRSSELKALKKKSDGFLAWSEFLRQYQVTLQQSKLLDQIVEIQKKRLKAENERFSNGRSVTATVITSESDAADAESNALKAKIGLRKYEASSQMYMSLDDVRN